MKTADQIADGLVRGLDKWYFAEVVLGAAIRRFLEKEGLPMPLNPAVRQGEYRISERCISMPEVMGALESAGFRLHRRWQYKSSGVISSFYEGTYGSIGVHCDWKCKWNSPESGTFNLYFRPPEAVTQTHWRYLAYYEKETFPQQLEEIIVFLNSLLRLSDEFDTLFAKAEKKLSLRKTLLASMLHSITAEPGLCYDVQQNAHSCRLSVCLPSEHCLFFHLSPPADAAQVQQMMEAVRQLIREMPEVCGNTRACHFSTESGKLPKMPAKQSPPLPRAPSTQRIMDFLESLCAHWPGSCSLIHRGKSSTLCVQLMHERVLRLRIAHNISEKELAELPPRIRKVKALLNAAGGLTVELTQIPADIITWTQNPAEA